MSHGKANVASVATKPEKKRSGNKIETLVWQEPMLKAWKKRQHL